MPWAVAAAAVGAAGAIGGGLLSSNAATSAAGTQAAAAQRAQNAALAQVQQSRTDLSPFRLTGASANTELGNLFGLSTNNPNVPTGTVGDYLASSGSMNLPGGYKFVNTANGLNIVDSNGSVHWANVPTNAPIGDIIHSVAPDQEPVAPSNGGPTGGAGAGANPLASNNEQAALEATPGYKFTRDQGLKSVQNSAAARGLGTSGAALKGAASYATGLADSTYQTNLLNPLEYLSSLGENAANQSGSLGQSGTANANALGIGGANATAAGQVGSASGIAGALNGAGGSPLNYLLYSNLLNGGGGGSSGGGFYDNTSTLAGG